MNMKFMPKNLIGKWAVWFGIILNIAIIIELLLALLAFSVKGDATAIADTFIKSPFLLKLVVASSFTAGLAWVASFILGIISFVKHKEWLVWKSLGILYAIAILLDILFFE